MKKALIFALMWANSPVQAQELSPFEGPPPSYQTKIFGVDRDGRSFRLPRFLCVYSGSELRLKAVQDIGSFDMDPADGELVWEFTHSNGRTEEWRSAPYGMGGDPASVFRSDRRSIVQGVVLLDLPGSAGDRWRLELSSERKPNPVIYLVNAEPFINDPTKWQVGNSGAKCFWGPDDLYSAGPLPPRRY